MLEIEKVTTIQGFQTLNLVWNLLCDESQVNVPFFRHEWFHCCLSTLGQERVPFILIFKNNGCVVGIAPLWIYKESVHRIPVRKIGFISGPDTPFVDFIIHNEWKEKVIDMMLTNLFNGWGKTWDILSLAQWPEDSPNLECFKTLLYEQRKKYHMEESSQIPYISTHGCWNTFLHSRSSRFRKTYRHIVNKMSKLEDVHVECYHKNENGQLLEGIFSVSKNSWKQEVGVAISNRKDVQEFFTMFTDLAGKNSWLRAWFLKIENKVIAMEYDLEWEGKIYALRADFDEAFKSYSPGAFLEYQIIKNAFDSGYLEYNTGPGVKTYKLRWTDQSKANFVVHLFNENIKGTIIRIVEMKIRKLLIKIYRSLSRKRLSEILGKQ